MPLPAFFKPAPKNKEKTKESTSKTIKKGSATFPSEKSKILDSNIDPTIQVKLPPPIQVPRPAKQDVPSTKDLAESELPLGENVSSNKAPSRRKSQAPLPPAPIDTSEEIITATSESELTEKPAISATSDSDETASTQHEPELSKMMNVADVIQDNFIEIREAIAVLHDYIDPDRNIESDPSASEGLPHTEFEYTRGFEPHKNPNQSEKPDTSGGQHSGPGYEQGQSETSASNTSTRTPNVDPTLEQSADPDEFTGAGCYKFDSAENVDDYLRALGVGLVFRKVQSAANPVMTIYPCTPHEWAIKMDSIFRTREVKFEIGKVFADETFDGRPCQSLALIDETQRLVIHQHCAQGSDVKVLYECKHDSHMDVVLDSGPHRAVLHFTANPS